VDVMMNGRPATAKDSAVKAHPDLVPPILFAAMTGWRMRSEVLKLTWRLVDFGRHGLAGDQHDEVGAATRVPVRRRA
jgi:hypothetical protein